MSSLKRMAFISSNTAIQEAIIENIKEEGLREGRPCPCPDCDGILHKKMIEYTDTQQEPWLLIQIPVFACKCGFQARYKEGET